MKAETISPVSLLEKQAAWIDHYRFGLRVTEQGIVVSVGDGIAWIAGLPSVAMEDVLSFEDGSQGMVFDLTEDAVGAVLLHETDQLTAGTTVYLSPRSLSIPVGDNLLSIHWAVHWMGKKSPNWPSRCPWKDDPPLLWHVILSMNHCIPA